jgi:hypothetical protein
MGAKLRIGVGLVLGSIMLLAGCSSGSGDASDSAGDEALSQSQCNTIVATALKKATDACAQTEQDADDMASKRGALESNVVKAVEDLATPLRTYSGENSDTIAGIVKQCDAIPCSGELQRGDTKATCDVEIAFLRAGCYVDAFPKIEAAATSLDFSKQVDALKSALGAMGDQWWSLAAQEASLRAQHLVCEPYAGSAAQKTALYATCRTSCDAQDPTSLTQVNTGHETLCVPAGYDSVQDDVGTVVNCGEMIRPIETVGTVCECRERTCTQFTAIAVSASRGKPCTKAGDDTGATSGVQKVIWDPTAQAAHLECR